MKYKKTQLFWKNNNLNFNKYKILSLWFKIHVPSNI